MSKKDVTFALDVTMVGVDEREVKSVAADIIELCTFLLDEDQAPNSIVAGALLAATMLATDMVKTDGPMH